MELASEPSLAEGRVCHLLLIGLVVRGNWHDTWAQLIHPEVCQVFRGKHETQAAQASLTAGPGASNPLQSFLNLWLAEEQSYRKEWTPTLLSGVLATLPDSPLPGQEDARTPADSCAVACGVSTPVP